MNTSRRHAPIERERFARHALTSLGGLLGGTRRPRRDGSDDAARVRELAYAYSKTDPGFASDLYAAAARHEGLNGD